MRDFPYHEMRADENVIPCRPTLEEMGGDEGKLAQVMHGWADACDMAKRVCPPDSFLFNANEEMRIGELMGTEEVSYVDVNGTHYVTIYELIRRLRESGG